MRGMGKVYFAIGMLMLLFARGEALVPPAIQAALSSAKAAGNVVQFELGAENSSAYVPNMELFGAATAAALELILIEANQPIMQCPMKLEPDWQAAMSELVDLVTRYQFYAIQAALQFGALINSPVILVYSGGLTVPILIQVLFAPLRDNVSCG
jgi:hypothetical protein